MPLVSIARDRSSPRARASPRRAHRSPREQKNVHFVFVDTARAAPHARCVAGAICVSHARDVSHGVRFSRVAFRASLFARARSPVVVASRARRRGNILRGGEVTRVARRASASDVATPPRRRRARGRSRSFARVRARAIARVRSAHRRRRARRVRVCGSAVGLSRARRGINRATRAGVVYECVGAP